MTVETVLKGNGCEYCGRQDRNPYKPFLQLQRDRAPEDKGGPPVVQRLRRALPPHAPPRTPEGRSGGRRGNESVNEMQTDLNARLETYNRNRPHRSRGMEGRTPYQVFTRRSRSPRDARDGRTSTRTDVKTAGLTPRPSASLCVRQLLYLYVNRHSSLQLPLRYRFGNRYAATIANRLITDTVAPPIKVVSTAVGSVNCIALHPCINRMTTTTQSQATMSQNRRLPYNLRCARS